MESAHFLLVLRLGKERLDQGGDPWFEFEPEDGRSHGLRLDRSVWEEMGKPIEVTVSVEPGDRLFGDLSVEGYPARPDRDGRIVRIHRSLLAG